MSKAMQRFALGVLADAAQFAFGATQTFAANGALAAPSYPMSVGVGVYFEHVFAIDPEEHIVKADFWVAYRWQDQSNFTSLFAGNKTAVQVEQATCGAQAPSSPMGPGRRFLELDGNSGVALYQPDLHIRNLRLDGSSPRSHSRTTRLYEDGTVERLEFIYAKLELVHPNYAAYPFDRHTLTVQVESLEHSSKRVVLTPLPEFSGLELALTAEWPGWSPVEGSVRFETHEVAPDYTHMQGNEHRCERRSRYHLDVEVKRGISAMVKGSYLPLFIQVALTWTSFFISIRQLMPRVAVAFISYLTLSNTANALASGLPSVSYQVWLSVFILSQRLAVLLTMIETAAVFYVTEHFATRVGVSLDLLARVLVPVDYLLFSIILLIVGTTHGKSDFKPALFALEICTYVNFFAMLLTGTIYCVVSYRRLYASMRKDPLAVHRASRILPLDPNEINMMFHAIDHKENGFLELDELVGIIMTRAPSGDGQQAFDVAQNVREHLRQRGFIRQLIDAEFFHLNYKTIMMELSMEMSSRLKQEKSS
mmetsp:Transcript_88364/g.274682  ORF Transcript_88364/g.274682 Transcript_88364/m.274682 type:complete len:536 (+) Transcript_88364:71-1678(+)